MNVAGKQVLAGLAVNAAGKHGCCRTGCECGPEAGLAVNADGKHGASRNCCECGWGGTKRAGLTVNAGGEHGVQDLL